MNSPFKTNTPGTPLTLINTDQYPAWLEQQTPSIQSWLKSIDYQGEGVALIPSPEGSIDQAIFAAEAINQPYACGDLPRLLPAGDYQPLGDAAAISAAAFAWGVGCYRFDRYKTAATEHNLPKLVITEALLAEVEPVVEATALVRTLINTPAGDMMPEDLGAVVKSFVATYKADVAQIIGDDLLADNYPAIHAVGRASVHPPRLIDLRWGDKNHPKVTIVGKGVCFDSGGLDIKPADGKRNMKKDMGGAAHAIALAQLIMAKQLPVRLRLLVPAVENAIASNAYRPGDIITTRKGLTVEVDNTDAEGRLILCDALAEADSENPEVIMDFATLTGACRVALGADLPGFFTNHPILASDLMAAAEATDEPVWQMPLHKPYKASIKGEIADLVSRAPAAMKGGAIMAALYLECFVSEETPWCHFDIMAWNHRALPGRPVGGEAVCLRSAFAYLQRRFG